MFIKTLLSVIILSISLNAHCQQLVQRVNPFIGTANSGYTHPGAVMPWGMVSLSPFNSYDTVTRSASPSPYVYGNKYIYGFTHFNLSGVGCPDLGTFCFMPVTGALNVGRLHKSEYSAEQEAPGGKTFTIEAKSATAGNYFIRSMKLNGRRHNKFRISHNDIATGGKLDFILKSKKQKVKSKK